MNNDDMLKEMPDFRGAYNAKRWKWAAEWKRRHGEKKNTISQNDKDVSVKIDIRVTLSDRDGSVSAHADVETRLVRDGEVQIETKVLGNR